MRLSDLASKIRETQAITSHNDDATVIFRFARHINNTITEFEVTEIAEISFSYDDFVNRVSSLKYKKKRGLHI
jgi:hypothetical protein